MGRRHLWCGQAGQLTGLTAGDYTLVEADVAGYAEGSWSCIPDVGGGAFDNGAVTLAPGEAVTCAITNDDIPGANLSITKTDGSATAAPGGTTTYFIVVSNAGPSTVSDAAVTDSFPAELNCTFTSVAVEGASGNTGEGSGDIGDTLVLPPGSSVTYTAPCDIDAEASGILSNTASVESAVSDPNPGDESATDETSIGSELIFRDGFEP
jgi:uncharacterized repeat protein (TIGR01451 family)